MMRHKRDVGDNPATVSNYSSDGVHMDANTISNYTTAPSEHIMADTNNTTNYSKIHDYATTSPGVPAHINQTGGDKGKPLPTDTLPASAAATTTDGSGEYEQQEPAARKQLNTGIQFSTVRH